MDDEAISAGDANRIVMYLHQNTPEEQLAVLGVDKESILGFKYLSSSEAAYRQDQVGGVRRSKEAHSGQNNNSREEKYNANQLAARVHQGEWQ